MPKRPGNPLTTEELYRRALAIVDDNGLEALTMRRLAAAVGVRAPSLYNHVTGKEELIDGALGVMRAELRLPDPMPEDWKTVMETILMAYRRVLADHPNMMPLAGRRLPSDEDSGLAYLVQQGFAPDQAVELWQTLTALTIGFSLFSSGYADGGAAGMPVDFENRAAEWRDETYTRALRLIMETFESDRVAQRS
jgi:AcrR family transcriptional regulator